MSIVARGLERVSRIIRGRETPPPPPAAEVPAEVPAEAPPQRPYSEARALAAKAAVSGSWQPTAFSVTIGVAPCNHSCIFCPQSVHKPQKARWLELDLMRKVLNEMPEEGVQIGLSSFSETIAAPNLVPIVRLMKEVRPKLAIAMASNGTVYREDVMAQLMDAGLDQYSYSFDAATREDYAKIMQKDDFDRAWNNLERLVELRQKKNAKTKITTNIMAFQGREADFEKFRAHWEKKLDFVQWRHVGNWGGDNWKLGERMAEKGFIPVHQTPAKRYPCFSIMHHFKLQWDGHYYPCIAAVPDYQRDLENHSLPTMGHASEITWGEAWERLNKMRNDHLAGRWDNCEQCQSCNIWSFYDNIWKDETGADGSRRFVLED